MFRIKAYHGTIELHNITLSTNDSHKGLIHKQEFESIEEIQEAIDRSVYVFNQNDANKKAYTHNCNFVVERILRRSTDVTQKDLARIEKEKDTDSNFIGFIEPSPETLARRKKMAAHYAKAE